jgi:anti-sigma factor RsiW
MIDCPNGEMRDRLPDFVHGRLGAVAHAEVAAHTAACAACAAEVALLRDLRVALGGVPSVDVGRIVGALPTPPVRGARVLVPRERHARRFDWRVAAAVAGIAVIGGSALVVSRARPNGDREIQQVAVRVSMDADLAGATIGELEELLEELESFDGLPAGEPEATLPTPDAVEIEP